MFRTAIDNRRYFDSRLGTKSSGFDRTAGVCADKMSRVLRRRGKQIENDTADETVNRTIPNGGNKVALKRRYADWPPVNRTCPWRRFVRDVRCSKRLDRRHPSKYHRAGSVVTGNLRADLNPRLADEHTTFDRNRTGGLRTSVSGGGGRDIRASRLR